MRFFVLITIFQAVSAFVSRPLNTQRSQSSKVLMTVVSEHKSGLQELITMILEAIPLAINTPNPEMDKTKVIDNPPRFFKVCTFLIRRMVNFVCVQKRHNNYSISLDNN